jgi:hypothetical protein
MQSQDQVSVEVAGIVEEAWHAIDTLEHYQRDGEATGRARLEALYRQVTRAVASLDLDGLRAHAARIARVRHDAGYDRSEVLAAFYALEDAVWRHASSQLPEADRGWGLGLVGTAFANAREAVGQAFDALSPRALQPFLDLTPVFHRSAALETRPADDLVYPV